MFPDGTSTLFVALGAAAIAGAGWLGFRLGRARKTNDPESDQVESDEAFLAASGGVALLWSADDDSNDPDAPVEVLASSAVLERLSKSLLLSAEADGNELLKALCDREPALQSAINTLRTHGTPFTAATAIGAIRGSTFGPRAIVWIEPASGTTDLFDVLERAPFPAWRVGVDGKLDWLNQACLSAVEVSTLEEAVNQQTWFDTRTAVDGKAGIAGALTDEVRQVTVAGRRSSFRIATFPTKGGALGMALDVTEQIEAREVLARETRAHAETLDHLTDAVAVFGPDRRLLSRNRAFTSLWGLEEAWLDERPSHGEVLDRLRDRRRLPQAPNYAVWKQEELSLYTSVGALPDTLWTLPDGRTLRVARQRQPDGGLLLLFEDITDTVALKAQFRTQLDVQRATLDKLREAVAVFGADGKLRLSNQAFAEMWDLEDSFTLNAPDFSAYAERASLAFPNDEFWAETRARVTDPSAHVRQETQGEINRRDGAMLNWLTRPLPDGATLLAFTDVTAAKRVEAVLRESAAAFEDADKLKTEFVRNVSYQLRTPLTTIGGYAELLEAGIVGALTPAQIKHVGAIRSAADQLAKLIENILDLAMIEAGKMDLDLGDVRLIDALEEAAAMASTKAVESRVVVNVICDPSVGVIRADAKRIRQILFNLVSNAISHIGEGDSITLGARRKGDSVSLWVSDTGEIMDADRQMSAFDGFGSSDRRGAGVGLALVKRFVELHGGWVSLRSREGLGTTVTCHLPTFASSKNALPELDLAGV
jgi:signal transduction histidine kinase